MKGYYRLVLPAAMLISFALGAIVYGKPMLAANAANSGLEEESREWVPGGGQIVHLAAAIELGREVIIPNIHSFQSVNSDGTLGESCTLKSADVVTVIAVYGDWVGVTRKNVDNFSRLSNCPYDALLLISKDVFRSILDKMAKEVVDRNSKEEAARQMLQNFNARQ